MTRTNPVWNEAILGKIEADFSVGLTSQQIVQICTENGERLTEATFRKYVQLGLLPRSVRVGRKGQSRGSQGLYPTTTIRQLVHLRDLMRQGFTMDQIQREFLFVRGDIESLTRQLGRVQSALEAAVANRPGDEMTEHALREAVQLGTDLTSKLEAIERRLTMQARMARAVV